MKHEDPPYAGFRKENHMKYIIETQRLGLRKFAAEDAERLYANHLDEEVKKWIPNESYEDPEEAREAAVFFAAGWDVLLRARRSIKDNRLSAGILNSQFSIYL